MKVSVLRHECSIRKYIVAYEKFRNEFSDMDKQYGVTLDAKDFLNCVA